jgi:peroxiredoxin
MIDTGTTAPDAVVFKGPREPIHLSDLYSDGITVLLFFPFAFSSTCTAEMCTMAEDLAKYEQLGARVYGMSIDSPYTNIRFAKECGATFPILSDFNREASRAFDVLRPDLGGLLEVSERANFVIGRDGVVHYTWIGEHPGVMPPFDELAAAVAALG